MCDNETASRTTTRDVPARSSGEDKELALHKHWLFPIFALLSLISY